MSRRVLIVRSNPIEPDPRVAKTAEALSGAGYAVTVLGWDRSGTLPTKAARGYGTVILLPIVAGFGRGMKNSPQLLRWEAGLLSWLAKHRSEYDLIHACDFDTILPSLVIRALWRKPVVYDIFDFYSDMLRSTPRWVKALIRLTDRWAINCVDAVILPDDARRDQIRGTHPRRLTIVFNSPQDRPAVDIPSGEAGPIRIAFVGLLHKERGLAELIEVVARHEDWHLDLAGFGGDEEIILPQAGRLSNVTFHGRVPYEQALELEQRADVLVATYDPAIPNHRYASPNKLFEAMMLGKPIVVAAGTNMDHIVERTGCGVIVPYGDVSRLDQALAGLAADPALRGRLGAGGRRAYEKEYSWDLIRHKLLGLYRELAAIDGG